ncbi:MAG: DUF4271 domain-containing protein [Bacteroidota bacterium]|nr:DUF4271 domain-containing protein [Bacteroidota bacterium]
MQGDAHTSVDSSYQSGFYGPDSIQYVISTDSVAIPTISLTTADSLLKLPVFDKSLTCITSKSPGHPGIVRPTSTISESFLFVLLLLVILIMNRIIRSGPRFFLEMIRGVVNPEGRSFNTESVLKRSLPFFWILNVSIITLAARLFIEQYTSGTVQYDSWLFWKLGAFVVAFWAVKQFLSWLIGIVFFGRNETQRLLMVSQVVLTFFSMTLIPILILCQAGIQIPINLAYAWPVAFLILPRIYYSFKSTYLFLAKKGGYLYLILYLCTLEILPLLLFLRCIFLV